MWRIQDGRLEVAVVHRPRYDDWSLPKGKLERGESELAAAVREVREEIGADVVVSRLLGSVGYDIGAARKRSTFWVMRHVGGDFRPSNEVDAVEWLPPVDAHDRLTYSLERQILADFAAVPLPESVIVLVRHAKAGKRGEWRGDDALRPLDSVGELQAARLAGFLQVFGPDRVISAEPVRCVDTVRPFANASGVPIEVDPVFGDLGYESTPEAAETALLALAKPGQVTVVSSQGTAIPGLLDRVVRGVRPTDTRKGAAWVLSIVDGAAVAADYYPHAAR